MIFVFLTELAVLLVICVAVNTAAPPSCEDISFHGYHQLQLRGVSVANTTLETALAFGESMRANVTLASKDICGADGLSLTFAIWDSATPPDNHTGPTVAHWVEKDFPLASAALDTQPTPPVVTLDWRPPHPENSLPITALTMFGVVGGVGCSPPVNPGHRSISLMQGSVNVKDGVLFASFCGGTFGLATTSVSPSVGTETPSATVSDSHSLTATLTPPRTPTISNSRSFSDTLSATLSRNTHTASLEPVPVPLTTAGSYPFSQAIGPHPLEIRIAGSSRVSSNSAIVGTLNCAPDVRACVAIEATTTGGESILRLIATLALPSNHSGGELMKSPSPQFTAQSLEIGVLPESTKPSGRIAQVWTPPGSSAAAALVVVRSNKTVDMYVLEPHVPPVLRSSLTVAGCDGPLQMAEAVVTQQSLFIICRASADHARAVVASIASSGAMTTLHVTGPIPSTRASELVLLGETRVFTVAQASPGPGPVAFAFHILTISAPWLAEIPIQEDSFFAGVGDAVPPSFVLRSAAASYVILLGPMAVAAYNTDRFKLDWYTSTADETIVAAAADAASSCVAVATRTTLRVFTAASREEPAFFAALPHEWTSTFNISAGQPPFMCGSVAISSGQPTGPRQLPTPHSAVLTSPTGLTMVCRLRDAACYVLGTQQETNGSSSIIPDVISHAIYISTIDVWLIADDHGGAGALVVRDPAASCRHCPALSTTSLVAPRGIGVVGLLPRGSIDGSPVPAVVALVHSPDSGAHLALPSLLLFDARGAKMRHFVLQFMSANASFEYLIGPSDFGGGVPSFADDGFASRIATAGADANHTTVQWQMLETTSKRSRALAFGPACRDALGVSAVMLLPDGGKCVVCVGNVTVGNSTGANATSAIVIQVARVGKDLSAAAEVVVVQLSSEEADAMNNFATGPPQVFEAPQHNHLWVLLGGAAFLISVQSPGTAVVVRAEPLRCRALPPAPTPAPTAPDTSPPKTHPPHAPLRGRFQTFSNDNSTTLFAAYAAPDGGQFVVVALASCLLLMDTTNGTTAWQEWPFAGGFVGVSDVDIRLTSTRIIATKRQCEPASGETEACIVVFSYFRSPIGGSPHLNITQVLTFSTVLHQLVPPNDAVNVSAVHLAVEAAAWAARLMIALTPEGSCCGCTWVAALVFGPSELSLTAAWVKRVSYGCRAQADSRTSPPELVITPNSWAALLIVGSMPLMGLDVFDGLTSTTDESFVGIPLTTKMSAAFCGNSSVLMQGMDASGRLVTAALALPSLAPLLNVLVDSSSTAAVFFTSSVSQPSGGDDMDGVTCTLWTLQSAASRTATIVSGAPLHAALPSDMYFAAIAQFSEDRELVVAARFFAVLGGLRMPPPTWRAFTPLSSWAGVSEWPQGSGVPSCYNVSFPQSSSDSIILGGGFLLVQHFPLLLHVPTCVLNLTSAEIEGEFPFASLWPGILQLSLARNAFGGRFSAESIPLGVIDLDISRNQFMLDTAALFNDNSSLVSFDCSGNAGLSNERPLLAWIPHTLRTLFVSSNAIRGSLVDVFSKPDTTRIALEYLDLSNNSFEGDISSLHAGMLPPSLQTLIIAVNRVNGTLSAHTFRDTGSTGYRSSPSLTTLIADETHIEGTISFDSLVPHFVHLSVRNCTSLYGDLDLTPLGIGSHHDNPSTGSAARLVPLGLMESVLAHAGVLNLNNQSSNTSWWPILYLDFSGTQLHHYLSHVCPLPENYTIIWPAESTTQARDECVVSSFANTVPMREYCSLPTAMAIVPKNATGVLRIINASAVNVISCSYTGSRLIFDRRGAVLFVEEFVRSAGACFGGGNGNPAESIAPFGWSLHYNMSTGELTVTTPTRTFEFSTDTCGSWRATSSFCAESFMVSGMWFKVNITAESVVATEVLATDTNPAETACTFPSVPLIVNTTDSSFPVLYPFEDMYDALSPCLPDGTSGFSTFTAIQVQSPTTLVPVDQLGRSFPMHSQACANAVFHQIPCDLLPSTPPAGRSDTCYRSLCGEIRTITWRGCNGGSWRSGFNKVDSCRPLKNIINSILTKAGAQPQAKMQCLGNVESCLLANASYAQNVSVCQLATGKYAGLLTCYLMNGLDPGELIHSLRNKYVCDPSGGSADFPPIQVAGHNVWPGICEGTLEERYELCELLLLMSLQLDQVSVRGRCSDHGDYLTLISCEGNVPIVRLPTRQCLPGGMEVSCSPCDPYIEPTAHALPYQLLILSTLKDILFVLFGAMVLDKPAVRSRTTRWIVALLIRLMPYRGDEVNEWRRRWHRRLNPKSVEKHEFRACFDTLIRKMHRVLRDEPASCKGREDLSRRLDALRSSPRRSFASQQSNLFDIGIPSSALDDESLLSRSGSPSFIDVEDEHFYDWFVRHVLLRKTQILTQDSLESDDVLRAFIRLYNAFARHADYTEPLMHIQRLDPDEGSEKVINAGDDDADADAEAYVNVTLPQVLQKHLSSRLLKRNARRGDGGDVSPMSASMRSDLSKTGFSSLGAEEPLICVEDVLEGLELDFALMVFNHYARYREVVLERTQLDRRFTPQAWMLSLQLMYAVIFLLICCIESGSNTYTHWDAFQVMYFRYVNSCTSVSLITNALLRRMYRYKEDGLFDAFLVVSVLMLMPALTHIVPGLILYSWVTVPILAVVLPSYWMLQQYEKRHEDVVNVKSVAIRVATRFLLTFAITVVLQSSFNYGLLFFERKALHLNYLGVVRYEYDSRRWECFMIYSFESLTSFFQLLSAAI